MNIMKDVNKKYVLELRNSTFIRIVYSMQQQVQKKHSNQSISRRDMEIIYSIIRERKPAVIVETGVHVGYSSIIMLYALNKNGKGKLISMDNFQCKPDLIPTFILDEYFDVLLERWDFYRDNSKVLLMKPFIDKEKVDMFLHDSMHNYETMSWEYQWALNHMENGGLIFSHDINASKAFFEFAKKNGLATYKTIRTGVMDVPK